VKLLIWAVDGLVGEWIEELTDKAGERAIHRLLQYAVCLVGILENVSGGKISAARRR
jgi:hypothetical protein